MNPKLSFSVWLYSIAALTLLCCSQPSLAFHQAVPPTKNPLSRQSSFLSSPLKQNKIRWNAGTSAITKITSTSATTTTSQLQAHELEGAMSAFDNFFRTQPFLSAFVACSVKASAADFLAQASETEDEAASSVVATSASAAKAPPSSFLTMFTASSTTAIEQQEQQQPPDVNLNRNVAFLLYGGLYQGMFLQFLYMVVYPFLYGDSVFRVPLTILTDICAFGPFVTLPLAYILRAVIESNNGDGSEENSNSNSNNSNELEETLQQGIAKYKNHVVTQGLLYKYWSIWAPAQTINFLFVPEHLRVFFVAFVSFFWVFLLSGISSQQQPQDQQEQPANAARA